MTEIVYIVAGIDKALAFEWIATGIDKSRFNLSFIFMDGHQGKTQSYLKSIGVQTHHIELHSKKDYPGAFLKIFKILRDIKPDIVHSHMREADSLGLSAARLVGIKNRYSTRHSSTYNHIYHPLSAKLDKLVNRLTTKTIAISAVVQRTLIEKEDVSPGRIKVIHHGFPLDYFRDVNSSRMDIVKQKHSIPSSKKVIGVVARHIEWKGVQYIIEAFTDLVQNGEDIFLVLANASGPYHNHLQNLLRNVPSTSYTNITFEEDIPALYRCFDIYIHTPIDPDIEAFGQTYVEALASGIPSIFSLSGIAHDLIKDGQNALVVPHRSPEAIKQAMERLLQDQSLGERLSAQGLQDVEPFGLVHFISALEDLYSL